MVSGQISDAELRQWGVYHAPLTTNSQSLRFLHDYPLHLGEVLKGLDYGTLG